MHSDMADCGMLVMWCKKLNGVNAHGMVLLLSCHHKTKPVEGLNAYQVQFSFCTHVGFVRNWTWSALFSPVMETELLNSSLWILSVWYTGFHMSYKWAWTRTENIIHVHKGEELQQSKSLCNYKPDTYYFFSNKNINQTDWWAASWLESFCVLGHFVLFFIWGVIKLLYAFLEHFWCHISYHGLWASSTTGANSICYLVDVDA